MDNISKSKDYIARLITYFHDEEKINKLTLMVTLDRNALYQMFKDKEIDWFDLKLNEFIKSRSEEAGDK